jgi:hypothetical protein
MADSLDADTEALKEWLRGAWRRLADPALTPFERRELRNYMKDAQGALRSGLKQIVAREEAARDPMRNAVAIARIDFRILKLLDA